VAMALRVKSFHSKEYISTLGVSVAVMLRRISVESFVVNAKLWRTFYLSRICGNGFTCQVISLKGIYIHTWCALLDVWFIITV